MVHNSEPAPAGQTAVLVVGEASTFEYSKQLAIANPKIRVVATAFPDTPLPQDALPINLIIVRGKIDARQLATHFPNEKFNYVVFNAPNSEEFPYQKGPTGDLIDAVLSSARDVLKPHGEVRISSSGGMPGAARLDGHVSGSNPGHTLPEGYQRPRRIPFNQTPAEGQPNFGVRYQPRNNKGQALPTTTNEMKWYTFQLNCPG